MKFLGAAILSIFTLAARQVAADFHVLQMYKGENFEYYTSCPSDYYKCDCFQKGYRAGKVVGSPYDSSFSIDSGLCGMPKLDFWKQSDGNYYIYLSAGDGQVQGTCASN